MTTLKDTVGSTGGVPLYDTRNPYEKSLEEIVANGESLERKRRENMEPPENSVITEHVRLAPLSLMPSLASVASKLQVTRSILTRCLSPQIVSWYRDCLGLGLIADQYKELFEDVRKRPCCLGIRRQMQNTGRFSFLNGEDVSTTISSVAWVRATLSGYGVVLGARWSDLLLGGLAWSLTTMEHKEWDEANIEKLYQPEAEHIELFVGDMGDEMDCFAKKLARRVAKELKKASEAEGG